MIPSATTFNHFDVFQSQDPPSQIGLSSSSSTSDQSESRREIPLKTSPRRWTKEQDQQLIEEVSKNRRKNGSITWSKLNVPGRNSIQCNKRWNNILNPDINRSEMTLPEKMLIEELVKQDEYKRQNKTNWAKIAQKVNDIFHTNRTSSFVRSYGISIQPQSKIEIIEPQIDPEITSSSKKRKRGAEQLLEQESTEKAKKNYREEVPIQPITDSSIHSKAGKLTQINFDFAISWPLLPAHDSNQNIGQAPLLDLDIDKYLV